MSPEERRAYMQDVVTPQMAVLFRTFSPHAFPRVTCAACHGPGAADRLYRMPNPDLPMSAEEAAKARTPGASAASVFMVSAVEPAMARLLGRSPYDPATGAGYGCFGCHALDP